MRQGPSGMPLGASTGPRSSQLMSLLLEKKIQAVHMVVTAVEHVQDMISHAYPGISKVS